MVCERQAYAAPLEDAVVSIPVADKLEMLTEPCVVKHTPSISTHRKRSPVLDYMVFVEYKSMMVMLDRPAVDYSLSIILACRF